MDGTDILKVFCKPTKNFPEGNNYFYVDVDAEPLVNAYCWYLGGRKPHSYVLASRSDGRLAYKLHRELAHDYLESYPDYFIDHISMIEFDNCDVNLNFVSNSQNQYNLFCKGYANVRSMHGFSPRIKIINDTFYPFGQLLKYEDEACRLQHTIETEWLQEQLGSEIYNFSILEYRRGSLDILDLERTGQISHEEANYRHILKYADNAWYYYRYGLQDFFKEHHIPVPEYSLDAEGYMIDKITGKKLCPFYKK